MANERLKDTFCSENKEFWQQLFEKKDLANRLLVLYHEFGDRGMEIFHPKYGVSVVKAKPASALGDNFFSDAFLVYAEPKKHHKQFTAFVKVLPTNIVMREAACDAGIHQREFGMYCKLFPLLTVEIKVEGEQIPLNVPEVYYGFTDEASGNSCLDKDKGPGSCLVLENVISNGYVMRDKCLGADDEHVRVAFTSLAHLHALTLTALKNWINPITKECLLPKSAQFLFDKTLADYSPAGSIAPWVNIFIELAKDLNRPDVADWLEKLARNLDETMKFDTYMSCGLVPCILHGDFWINNMLFKYEEDRPIALKVVDFQMSRIGHPVSDILYFMFTSTTSKLRRSHARDWLRHYYETLMRDMALLKTDVTQKTYSWEEFLNDFKKRSLRWMLFSGMIMSLVLNKKVADELEVIHRTINEQQQNEAKLNKTEGGDITTKLTEKFTGMMKANKITNNSLLAARLIELFEEVKDLNEGKENFILQ